MRSRILALLVILVLMVPMAVFAQDEDEEPTGEGEIRAVWNQEILVLINISDDGVNASNLSLVSENGEVAATDFVMELEDEDADVPYSLADVRPGSCLLVYLAGTAPTVPDTVVCTRVIGEFTPENITDIVWDISQGGFSTFIDEEDGTDCSIERTSCDIPVITGGPDYSLEDPNPEYTDIRAIWTQDILVLLNVSDFGVDLSSLTLFSASGEILPETLVMLPDEENEDELFDLADVRPGSCLIIYLGDEDGMPEMPEEVECTRVISETSLENPGDMVWVFEQGGFSAFTEGNTELDLECSVEDTTTCDISVPNADYDPDLDMDMDMEAEPEATEEGSDG